MSTLNEICEVTTEMFSLLVPNDKVIKSYSVTFIL